MTSTLVTTPQVYSIATIQIHRGAYWESIDKNFINTWNKFPSIYGRLMSMNTLWHSQVYRT